MAIAPERTTKSGPSGRSGSVGESPRITDRSGYFERASISSLGRRLVGQRGNQFLARLHLVEVKRFSDQRGDHQLRVLGDIRGET